MPLIGFAVIPVLGTLSKPGKVGYTDLCNTTTG